MFVLLSEHAQICEDYAIFKQNYSLEMFIAFKMAYFWYFTHVL